MKNLSYKEFLEEFLKELTERAGQMGAEVHPGKDHRNGVDVDTVCIRFSGQTCCPLFYLNDYYDRHITSGQSIPDMAELVMSKVTKTEKLPFDLSIINQKNAQESIILAVNDYAGNRQWLEEKGIPYDLTADGSIATYPRWIIDDAASFAVSYGLLDNLCLTKDEILEMASKNTQSKGIELMPIEDMISVLAEIDMGSENCGLVLAKLVGESYGASVIAEKTYLDEMYRYMGGDYYILPSSIHEVLLYPKNDEHLEEIRRMVREVNNTTVSIRDKLSDEVLEYDGHKLTIAGRGENINLSEKRIEEMLEERGIRHAI